MTEKEIIREAAKMWADKVEWDTDTKWANDIWKALAATEDTDGEKCPKCNSTDKELRGTIVSGYGVDKCGSPWHNLPPKEQDDEAMEAWIEAKVSRYSETKEGRNAIRVGWKAAYKRMKEELDEPNVNNN